MLKNTDAGNEPVLNQYQTDKLKQLLVESTISRRNILQIVKREAAAAVNTNLTSLFQAIISSLNIWLDSLPTQKSNPHKTLKHKLSKFEVDDLALEIIVAVVMERQLVPIQSVVAKIATHIDFEDEWEGIKAAGELLGVCEHTGLYTIVTPQDGGSLLLESNIQLDNATQAEIDSTRYLDPMLCRPMPWKENRGGGYLLSHDHVVLGKGNNHEEKQALDALNIVQNIQWELDEFILQFKEEPTKPFETIAQKHAFNDLVNMSDLVYQNMLKHGNKFYFTWKFDFRGRMYSQGYYINLQSTSYKKALLNFKHKELIQ